MSTVKMEMECGCFKRSGYESEQQFNTKKDALERANEMVEDMNESFCGVHHFTVQQSGDTIIINVAKNF